MHSLILANTFLKLSHLHSNRFDEKASHIHGLQTKFTVSLRSSSGLLATLKNSLKLEQSPIGIKSLHSEPTGNKEDCNSIDISHKC
jgi:hypothetical protein